MATIGTVEGILKLTDSFTGPLKKISSEIEKSQREVINSGKKLADAYSRLAADLDPAVARQQQYKQAQVVLDEALKKGIITQREYNVQLAAAKAKYLDAAEAVKPYAERLQDLGRQMSSIGRSLSVAVTLPILAVGGAAIKMATDAVEAENLFEVSFGSMSDAARKWSEETGKALGLNRVELRKNAGTIFVMTEQMGLSTSAAFEMSTGMTKLANDMASFFNLNPEEAFQKLRSGIVGETEPLRRLGILVDEATVKSVAYAAGIAKVGSELTQTQKVAARWVAIQQQTVKVQGDLARTMESPANQLRRLRTQIEEAAIALGTALLPAFQRVLDLVERVTRRLEPMVNAFSGLPPPIQNLIIALVAAAAAAGPVLFIAGQLIISWGAFSAFLPTLTAGIGSVVAVITGPVGWIAAGVALLLAWRPVREFLVDLGQSVLQTVIGWVQRFVSAAREWWASTREGRQFLAALARVIIDDLGAAISRVITFLKAWFSEQVRNLKMAADMARAFLGWSGALDAVRYEIDRATLALKLLWEQTSKSFRAVVEWVDSMGGLAKVVGAFDPVAGAALGKMKEWAERAKASAEWSRKLGESNRQMAQDTEEGVLSIEAMDVASADLLAEIDKLNAKTKELSEEEKKRAEALKESVRSMEDSAAVTNALARALFESIEITSELGSATILNNEQYEILNTLLQAGIPLAEALSGKYDAMAKALISSSRALELELALREEEKKLATEILDLYEQLGRARESISFGTIEAPELEMEWPLPTAEDLEKMTADYRATIGKMAADLEAIQKRAWENVQDTASSAIAEIIKTGKIDFESLFDSVINIVAQMLAKMLIIWLANIATRTAAEVAGAATAAAAWATVGSGVGGNTGGSSLGGLSSLWKGAKSLWNAGGAALGAVAIVGITAAFAYWAHSQAAKKAAERWFNVAVVRDGWTAMFGSVEFVGLAEALAEKIRELFTAIGAEMSTLGEIRIDVQATGERFKAFVDDVLIGYFHSFEEAFQAAAFRALAQSDLANVLPDLANAISTGAIQSFEELSKVADVFIRIQQVVNPAASEISAFNAEVAAMRQVLIDAGIAATALAEYTAVGLQSIRDSITGVVKTEEQIQRERMEAFNAHITAEETRLTAILASADAQAAAAAAEIARIEIVIAGIEAQGELNEKALQFLATLYESLGLAQAALASATASAAEARALLESLPDLITEDELRPPKSGGGGGGSTVRSDMERLAELLDQMAFDRALAGMTDLEAGLAQLAREYEQNMELAHGDAELVAQLTEEYRLQAEQLLKNIQLSAVDTFQDFMGIGADPFSQLTESWENASKAVEEAGFGADRTALMLARLNKRYEEQLAILSQQQFVAIGDGLLGILERYYGDVEGFEKFRLQLEQVRFELELANLRLQFEILQKSGSLSAAVLEGMQEVFDFIAENPIDWDEFLNQSGVKDFFARLRGFEAGPQSGLQDALRGVNQTARSLRDEALDLAKAFDWSSERLAKALGRINAAARAQRVRILEDAQRDTLLAMLDFLGKSEEAERIRFELQRMQLLIAYEELKIAARKHKIELDALARIGQLAGEIAGIAFEDWSRIQGSGGGGGGGGADDAARELADALNRVKDIYAGQLSPFEQAIRSVVDEFADLRRVLGWTTELQELYALELRRVIDEQLSSIQRLRDELTFRADSPVRTIDQFRMAQEQANAAMSALASGDLSQLDAIPDLISRVLELNPSAQSSEASRFLFAWADSMLAQAQSSALELAEGIEPGGANDPFAWLRHTPTAGDDAVVEAVNRVASRQDVQTAEERAEAEREAAREQKRIEREAAKEEREQKKAEARIEKIITRLGNANETLRDIRYELRQAGKLDKAS